MLNNPVERSVIEPVQHRYSPYLFADKPVTTNELHTCLEAARWAASSFNDQPWSWIVARREDADAFETMLQILAEPNQAWASKCSVLMLSVMRTKFRQNGKDNRVALHDLGAAAALMSLQATSIGLQIHQMAGLDQDAAAKTYGVPDHHVVQTAIALGHPLETEPSDEQQELRDRETGARQRLTLAEQVFSGKWGTSPAWLN